MAQEMHSRRSDRAIPLLIKALTGASLASVLTVGGCSSDEKDPAPVQASAFYQPAANQTPSNLPPSTEPSPATAPAGQASGATSPDALRTPRLTEQSVAVAANQPAASSSTKVEPLSNAPAATPTPTTPTPPAPTTSAPRPRTPSPKPAPSTTPPITTGTYMTIGGVLAEVNGVPIFAARVMRELEPVLSARAKELEPRPFELEASNLITRQINEFVSEELEYASAQRSLDTDDKKLADLLTTDFRQKKITEAGGSLEQAKRLATEQGNNFEEQINQRNRLFLIQIYYQKKVFPRVQITTSDMREYYAQNVDKLFTEKSEATFRLIRVDPNRVGGKEKALERIKTLRDRANSEDFADLAKTANDDSTLSRSGGKVGPIARNTLALEKVEDAVFRLEPGQVSEIIEDRGGFYIAKLETKKTGSVKPFDDPAVQDRVRRELNSLQVAQMRQQIRADLEKNAIVRRDPRMLQTALDMATQRYPMWRARS